MCLSRARNLLLSVGFSQAKLAELPRKDVLIQVIDDEAKQTELEQLAEQHEELKADFDKKFEVKRRKITQGDDLAPGVLEDC